MQMIRTDFVESESVGFRQIRITFPNQVSEIYFQEFKSTDGWFRLSDGSRASSRMTHLIDGQVAHHQQRKRDRLAAFYQASDKAQQAVTSG